MIPTCRVFILIVVKVILVSKFVYELVCSTLQITTEGLKPGLCWREAGSQPPGAHQVRTEANLGQQPRQ